MKLKHWLALVAGLAAVAALEIYVWRTGPVEPEPSATSFDPNEYFPRLGPGEMVPPFTGEYIDGGTEIIDYPLDGGKTLLFVLSPSCGTCDRTIPTWNRIARQIEAPARAFGMVIGSYQGERRLAEEGRLEFSVLRFTDQETLQQYKISKVPQTILVAPGGKVEKAIVGKLTDEQADDLVGWVVGQREESRS